MLRIGETIDRYRVEALIGQGGMAAVYKARHTQLDSEHAIKVLFITAPLIRERLLREGKVQANLRHPNVVSVTDVLEVLGAPALVMEYVDGPALDSWLLENKPTLDESLWLFRGVLRGISAAHERGVIHRDLKPANVLLAPTNDGLVPKVTDFGLVKSISDQEGQTQAGMALGTPEYMSPEQIRDASDVDPRSDMWALGCLLYELVCHRRAFSGPDKMSTFNAIVAGTYEPPRKFVDEDIPRNVAEAIRWLLEVDRDKRLSSCEELYDLLYEERDPAAGRLAAPNRPATPLLVGSLTPVDTVPLPAPKLARELAMPSGLADVPTGAPAIRRGAAPTGLRDDRPSVRQAELPGQASAGLTMAIPILLATIVGLAIVAGIVGLSGRGGDGGSVATAPGTPTLAETVPERPPDPVPEPVVAVAPDPEPPPPPVKPRPVKPRPVKPQPPKPEPAVVVVEVPAVEPAGEVAHVSVVGGSADEVWLVLGGKRFKPGEDLAPGRYQVKAGFGGGELVGAGSLDLRAGDDVKLSCDGFLQQCRAQ